MKGLKVILTDIEFDALGYIIKACCRNVVVSNSDELMCMQSLSCLYNRLLQMRRADKKNYRIRISLLEYYALRKFVFAPTDLSGEILLISVCDTIDTFLAKQIEHEINVYNAVYNHE